MPDYAEPGMRSGRQWSFAEMSSYSGILLSCRSLTESTLEQRNFTGLASCSHLPPSVSGKPTVRSNGNPWLPSCCISPRRVHNNLRIPSYTTTVDGAIWKAWRIDSCGSFVHAYWFLFLLRSTIRRAGSWTSSCLYRIAQHEVARASGRGGCLPDSVHL